jgi:hypothetical protein
MTMAGRVNRKFYKYTLQAHGAPSTYDAIFAALRGVNRQLRLAEVGSRRVFVSDITRNDHGIVIRFLSIQPDTDFTTFDEVDFTTSDESLPTNKRFAVASHGYYLFGTRKLIFEYVRSGPKVEEALSAVQFILRARADGYRQLRLTATPVIEERFVRDIDRFERIRVVTIDVAEPNANWTDWDDPLHELGEESGAGRVTLEATAARGEGLHKRNGIVQVLKQALRATNSHLKRAVVEGKMPDESGPRTIRTDRMQEFSTRRVAVDSGGSADILSVSAVFDGLAEEDNGGN